ncbi:MAG: hypothetical protein M1817_005256 [Caeruleum heppii]|nr:MAG: hypothetical protein M1817_005256 [Caeruleum heppii]
MGTTNASAAPMNRNNYQSTEAITLYVIKHYASLKPETSINRLSDLCSVVYPDITYTEAEKSEIDHWLPGSADLETHQEGDAAQAPALKHLEAHLSSRTATLGTKPSPADLVIYARLASTVRHWTPEQRTGEHGYPHIARFLDFVQNSPLIGAHFADDEKVLIDVNDVRFIPKPVDHKEEKERKKREKAAVTADGSAQPKPSESRGTNNSPAAESSRALPSRPKKEKAPKPAKAPAAAKELTLSPSLIDLRVGHILEAIPHPNADSLYVSTIVCGDPTSADNTSTHSSGQTVRTVCSGLNGLVPLEEMQGRRVIVVCNLKPVTMRGIKSAAMVLAASPRLAEGETDAHKGPVELVDPPQDASPGERVFFEGWADSEPEKVLNPKKKVWDYCQVGFTTTEALEVAFDASAVEQLKEVRDTKGVQGLARLRTASGGACTVKSLQAAVVR